MTSPTPPALPPVDVRAGKLCSACNHKRPAEADVEYHCGPKHKRYCRWWRCPRCRAWNDPGGRNDKVSLNGQRKDGAAR